MGSDSYEYSPELESKPDDVGLEGGAAMLPEPTRPYLVRYERGTATQKSH